MDTECCFVNFVKIRAFEQKQNGRLPGILIIVDHVIKLIISDNVDAQKCENLLELEARCKKSPAWIQPRTNLSKSAENCSTLKNRRVDKADLRDDAGTEQVRRDRRGRRVFDLD